MNSIRKITRADITAMARKAAESGEPVDEANVFGRGTDNWMAFNLDYFNHQGAILCGVQMSIKPKPAAQDRHPLSPAERTAALLAPRKQTAWHKCIQSSPSRLHRATGAMRTA